MGADKPFNSSLSLRFKVMMVAALSTGLTGWMPSAQSQVSPTTFTKTASPNPATVGQEFVFTLVENNDTGGVVNGSFTDVFPPGETFSGTFDTFLTPGTPPDFITCVFDPASNTLDCVFSLSPGGSGGVRVGFIPGQPGFITNKAVDSFGNVATATVCVQSPGGSECTPPSLPQQQNHQQPVCPPASQELGNEAQSSDVNLSGDITSSGDSSNQTASPLDFGNTGNLQNAQGVLQQCGSESGDVELSGGSIGFSPSLDSSSNQTIEQAAGGG